MTVQNVSLINGKYLGGLTAVPKAVKGNLVFFNDKMGIGKFASKKLKMWILTKSVAKVVVGGESGAVRSFNAARSTDD